MCLDIVTTCTNFKSCDESLGYFFDPLLCTCFKKDDVTEWDPMCATTVKCDNPYYFNNIYCDCLPNPELWECEKPCVDLYNPFEPCHCVHYEEFLTFWPPEASPEQIKMSLPEKQDWSTTTQCVFDPPCEDGFVEDYKYCECMPADQPVCEQRVACEPGLVFDFDLCKCFGEEEKPYEVPECTNSDVVCDATTYFNKLVCECLPNPTEWQCATSCADTEGFYVLQDPCMCMPFEEFVLQFPSGVTYEQIKWSLPQYESHPEHPDNQVCDLACADGYMLDEAHCKCVIDETVCAKVACDDYFMYQDMRTCECVRDPDVWIQWPLCDVPPTCTDTQYFNDVACECYPDPNLVVCSTECDLVSDPREPCACIGFDELKTIFPEVATFEEIKKSMPEVLPVESVVEEAVREYEKPAQWQECAPEKTKCKEYNPFNSLACRCQAMVMCDEWCEDVLQTDPFTGCGCITDAELKEYFPADATQEDIDLSFQVMWEDFDLAYFEREGVETYDEIREEFEPVIEPIIEDIIDDVPVTADVPKKDGAMGAIAPLSLAAALFFAVSSLF